MKFGSSKQKAELDRVHSFVDASYAIYKDCKGQTGLIIFLGDIAPICIKSWKQKTTGTSSTHSELIALFDSIRYIMTIKYIVKELTGLDEPVKIAQDNNSTIFIAENEFVKSNKMKFLRVRYHYIKELIDENEIELYKLRTEDMKSDGLTKPQFGKQFQTFVQHLHIE